MEMRSNWAGLDPQAVELLGRLCRAGHAAYPVGGCVRDLLMGREPGDVDVCTSALPGQVMALFPNAVPTGLKHGTVTVPGEGGGVEITTFRREGGYADARHPDVVTFDVGLTEDLSRRDFTINAMALPEFGPVIDPFGGRADLEKKIIRCVGEPERRFSEDALRMLRAVRFAAQLGFTIEPATAAALGRCAPLTARVSRERIRAEMEKVLLSPRPELVGEMIAAGLLDHLWPFPREADLSALGDLPAVPAARWRGFCAATGFPISSLPVERKLRRAVERPELEILPSLALSARDLMDLGLTGPAISAAQKALALHVLEHPEDNTPERLRGVLRER